jgi:hypothetical protein
MISSFLLTFLRFIAYRNVFFLVYGRTTAKMSRKPLPSCCGNNFPCPLSCPLWLWPYFYYVLMFETNAVCNAFWKKIKKCSVFLLSNYLTYYYIKTCVIFSCCIILLKKKIYKYKENSYISVLRVHSKYPDPDGNYTYFREKGPR